MSEPSILVLATGGTIVGEAGSAIRRDYRPGQIAIEDFLTSFRNLGVAARLQGRQIANIDSADIGPHIWHELHTACVQAMTDPKIAGVVITHGTDTAEETAFLLDQTLPTTRPVVVVGAMRPADAVGSDGLRNFASAVKVAGDPEAAGRGVLLLMGDQVLIARDARKARLGITHAFQGFPRGPVALATPSSVDWLTPPWREEEPARFAWPSKFPKVPILYAFAGMPPEAVAHEVSLGSEGIVLAGTGSGNAPRNVLAALKQAVAKGVPVVRASRVDEGVVDLEPEDETCGFIAARALGPAKARILLQLLIATGEFNRSDAQTAFNRR